MTEEDAKHWLENRFDRRQIRTLEAFVALLLAEASQQNLIARSTFEATWTRHIVDSAQLVQLAPSNGNWLDVGSGGGLPGIVIAILRRQPTILVEPRRKRAEFLRATASRLNLTDVVVRCSSVQSINDHVGVISARAVAPVETLFAWTSTNVSRETTYVLPRGRTAFADLETVQMMWQGLFHVEHSVTDPTAGIVVATQVTSR